MWHGYVLVRQKKDAAAKLEKPARDKVRGVFAEMALLHRAQPAERFQERVSLDGESAIYEITCSLADAAPEKVKDKAAKKVELSKKAFTERVDVAFFAYGGTWEESATACRDYLDRNRAEWTADERAG